MKNEKGFSLIEVMIAIALLGIIGVAFLGALATASNAIFIADERATAESLARSQMEYVKNQDYSIAPWEYELPLPADWPEDSLPSWWEDNPSTLPESCDGYTVNVTAKPLPGEDDYIQKITVTIKHLEKPDVITLEGYRSVR